MVIQSHLLPHHCFRTLDRLGVGDLAEKEEVPKDIGSQANEELGKVQRRLAARNLHIVLQQLAVQRVQSLPAPDPS